MEAITNIAVTPQTRIVRRDLSLVSGFNNEIDGSFKDYKTAVAETVKHNLGILEEIPLPQTLPLDELKEFFKKDIASVLSKDTTFEKAVQVQKYASNISQYLGSYFREIFELGRKLIEEANQDLFFFSRLFLNSNLPISFLRAVERSLLANKDFIAFFAKQIRREHRELIIYRSNQRKFDRVIDAHNKWAAVFGQKREKISRERTKLDWYVDFNNSSNLGEVFKEKFIKIELLDKKILDSFIANLLELTVELENLNYSRALFEPLPTDEVSDGTKAILSLMKLSEADWKEIE